MTVTKFIRKTFKLKALKVSNFFFKPQKGELHLWVKPYKNGCSCPQCGRRGKIVRIMPDERVWRDVSFLKWTLFFHYIPKEITCDVHGRIQEDIPWADVFSRVTCRFEFQMLRYCQSMTQTASAELLHIPKSTLSDLLHKTIARLRDGHRVRDLKHLGVDEISYCKGRKFTTIVYDMERAKVVWIGKGKGRETLDRFFEECLSDYQRKKIKIATSDMSQAYIGSIQANCPNAIYVLDKFHIVKAINEAVDEVRKEAWRKLSPLDRKAIKGVRWLLYRHSTNRTEADEILLKQLKKTNRHIFRASVLKDEFEAFWDIRDLDKAKDFLMSWTRAALKSRIESMRTIATTLRNNLKNIVSYAECQATNAMAEGLNRVIKIVKNRASGFRTLDAFSDLIFLNVGDLDLPGQYSPSKRTL